MVTSSRLFLHGFVCLAGLGFAATNSLAQEEEPNSNHEERSVVVMAADDGSGAAPMVISTTSSSINGGPAKFSFVAPGLDGNTFAMSLPMGDMGPMDPLGLIHSPDIQKEIELDKQQIDDYKKLNDEFQKQVQGLSVDLREGRMEKEKMKEFASTMKKLRDEQTSRVKDILLPHQFERLQQISTQQYLSLIHI